jgi:hypothetical protein
MCGMDFLENENKKNENVKCLEDFCRGDSSILDVVISREDREAYTLLHFMDAKTGIELFSQWRRKDNLWGKKKQPHGERIGNKEPYAMLFYRRIKKVFSKEYVGNRDCQLSALVMLSEFIQMGTGKLIDKRTKKPLTRDKVAMVLGLSVIRTAEIISDLKTNGIVERKNNAYYIKREFILRGRIIKCDTTSQIPKSKS